jgi:hypothetical protein
VPFYAVGASKSNLVNLQLQGSLLGIQALPGATGTLTVTIAAGDGFGNSVPTTLKIVLGVPQITQEPKASLTVKQKGTVTLKIKATGPKSATLSYEWLRNGKAVKDNGLIAGLHKASMSISNVQKNQAGTYTVLVADAFGLVSSTACVVKVK